MDLDKRIANIPFARILLPILIAIVLSNLFGIEISFYAFVVTIILIALFFITKRISTYLILFFFGLSLLWLQNRDTIKPYKIYQSVCVISSKPDNNSTSAKIITLNGNRYNDEIILLLDKHLDSTLKLSDTLSSTILLQEIFGSRIKERKVYIYNNINLYANIIVENGYSIKSGDGKAPKESILYKIRQFVSQRLSLLRISDADRSLLKAILIGDKTELDYNLSDRYRKSGVSHLLAISGWHIGILFLLLNFLLFFLDYNSRSKVVKSFIIILIIWCYSAITAFSPSVTRAAIMFTLLQLSFLKKAGVNMRFNILFGSAFILLCFQIDYLYNISFQLSYMAILSIMLFYKPILNLVSSRNRVLLFITKIVAITISAQILTLPIVLYHFGEYSLLSIISNLYMALLMPIVMILAIIFIALPLNIISDIIAIVLNMINSTMSFMLDSVGGYLTGIGFDGYLICAYYIFITIIVILLNGIKKNSNFAEFKKDNL